MKSKTKMFTEERVFRRVPGAVPGEWEPVRLSKPIDAQINEWVDETKAKLVFASAPSVTPTWLDKEMTTRSMLIAVIVAYDTTEEARKPDEQPYEWPEYRAGDGDPPPADAPFAGQQ